MISYDICDKCDLKDLHLQYNKLYDEYSRVSLVNKRLSYLVILMFVIVVILCAIIVGK